MRTFHRSLWASPFAAAIVLACALGARSATVPAGLSGFNAIDDSQAASYCKQVGGKPVHRVPVYGDSSDFLYLSGKQTFCEFTSASDGSRIHVLVQTLYTTEPSLAALAYYAQVQPGTCNGNPASCYCSLLGGSDLFGGPNDAAGGGWYKAGDVDAELEACIFPDMSSIDSWGLAYHSQGIIRGIDLSTVLRYKGPPKKANPFR